MNDDGQILVAMDNDMLQLSDNLFEDALKDDSRNSKAITNLKKQIETKSSGGGIFYLKEKYYYLDENPNIEILWNNTDFGVGGKNQYENK